MGKDRSERFPGSALVEANQPPFFIMYLLVLAVPHATHYDGASKSAWLAE